MDERGVPQREGAVEGFEDAAPIIVVQLDDRYRVRLVSEGCEQWFGVSADSATHYSVDGLLGQKAFQKLKPWILTAFTSNQPATYHGEVEYWCGLRVVHGLFVPALDESRPVGLSIILRDVSQDQSLRKQLADETLRSQTTVQHAIDGIITINSDGLIQSFNPAAERLFEYTADEVVGQNVNTLMPDPHHSDHDDYLKRYQRTREARIIGEGREVRARRKDGTLFDIRLAVAEFFLGQEQHFVGFIHDITDRKRAESEAREALEHLAHADRITAMGQLASGLAHEISQPLTAIQTTAEACRALIQAGKGDPERLDDAMEQVIAQSRRASDIIQELRGFIRKGQSDAVSWHDPEHLVHNVLPLLTSELERADVTVEVIAETALCHCAINRIQIEQVLVNLIRNAIDAMTDQPGERRLTVRTRLKPDAKYCEVDVADTGPGIAEEHRDKLFRPFFTTKEQGLGQGLSICRSIIESHGGSLSVHSADSGGTLFRFTLPEIPPGVGEAPND